MLHCPGAANIRIPELEVRKCPECGSEIEIFSNEFQSRCTSCGFVAYKDLSSCIQWCKFSEECLGADLYAQVKENVEKP
jgi:transposase